MRSTWRNAIEQGLVAGMIGFVTVALVLAVVSVIGGHSPFYLAALLGASLFYGVTDVAQLAVTPGYVFAYTGLHLAVFLLLGVAAAGLAMLADRGFQLWYLALFFFIFVAFHLFAGVQAMSASIRSELPGGIVWGAGIAASILMAAYLVRMHPKMRMAQSW